MRPCRAIRAGGGVGPAFLCGASNRRRFVTACDRKRAANLSAKAPARRQPPSGRGRRSRSGGAVAKVGTAGRAAASSIRRACHRHVGPLTGPMSAIPGSSATGSGNFCRARLDVLGPSGERGPPGRQMSGKTFGERLERFPVPTVQAGEDRHVPRHGRGGHAPHPPPPGLVLAEPVDDEQIAPDRNRAETRPTAASGARGSRRQPRAAAPWPRLTADRPRAAAGEAGAGHRRPTLRAAD